MCSSDLFPSHDIFGFMGSCFLPFFSVSVAFSIALSVSLATLVKAFCNPYGDMCVVLSICCQLCAALYQSLCDQLELSYALGTKPPLLLIPSALLLAKPMLAPLIVPALPPGVLAPPFENAKIGLSPALRISSTAL